METCFCIGNIDNVGVYFSAYLGNIELIDAIKCNVANGMKK